MQLGGVKKTLMSSNQINYKLKFEAHKTINVIRKELKKKVKQAI